ncbi:aldehyde dehydrogenase family protein, partial [Streptomyces europaeiscabiei]|uniref:aldehyde dehydrogenase family protein n=1 Tax=Streptomyces europaeiscabiei TaxID=146819 RepID=UPI003BAAF86E
MGQRRRGDPRRRGDRGRTREGAAERAGHADGEYEVSRAPQVPDRQRLFVGGSWTEPDGGHYEVVDPATEDVVGWAPEASRAQVHAAVAAARAA